MIFMWWMLGRLVFGVYNGASWQGVVWRVTTLPPLTDTTACLNDRFDVVAVGISHIVDQSGS